MGSLCGLAKTVTPRSPSLGSTLFAHIENKLNAELNHYTRFAKSYKRSTFVVTHLAAFEVEKITIHHWCAARTGTYVVENLVWASMAPAAHSWRFGVCRTVSRPYSGERVVVSTLPSTLPMRVLLGRPRRPDAVERRSRINEATVYTDAIRDRL